jgi:hypothetical protein
MEGVLVNLKKKLTHISRILDGLLKLNTPTIMERQLKTHATPCCHGGSDMVRVAYIMHA